MIGFWTRRKNSFKLKGVVWLVLAAYATTVYIPAWAGSLTTKLDPLASLRLAYAHNLNEQSGLSSSQKKYFIRLVRKDLKFSGPFLRSGQLTVRCSAGKSSYRLEYWETKRTQSKGLAPASAQYKLRNLLLTFS